MSSIDVEVDKPINDQHQPDPSVRRQGKLIDSIYLYMWSVNALYRNNNTGLDLHSAFQGPKALHIEHIIIHTGE